MSIINHAIARTAALFAAELEKRAPQISETINQYIVDTKEAKKGPYYTLLNLLSYFTAEELNALPVPGVPEFEDRNGVAVKNNHADTFKYMNENNREVTGSYYNVLFDRLPPGVELSNKLEALGKADQPSSPYFQWKKGEIDGKKKEYNDEKTTGRRALRNAMAAWHMMGAINALPGVRCFIRTFEQEVTDEAGNKVVRNFYRTDTTQPFMVQDLSEIKDGIAIVTKVKEYSVGGLIALDPSAVKLNEGNHYDMLLKTAGRDTDDDGTEGDPRVTIENIGGVMADFARFAENRKTFGVLVKMLTSANADPALVESFGDFMTAMNVVWNMPTVTGKYNHIIANKVPAGQAPVPQAPIAPTPVPAAVVHAPRVTQVAAPVG